MNYTNSRRMFSILIYLRQPKCRENYQRNGKPYVPNSISIVFWILVMQHAFIYSISIHQCYFNIEYLILVTRRTKSLRYDEFSTCQLGMLQFLLRFNNLNLSWCTLPAKLLRKIVYIGSIALNKMWMVFRSGNFTDTNVYIYLCIIGNC